MRADGDDRQKALATATAVTQMLPMPGTRKRAPARRTQTAAGDRLARAYAPSGSRRRHQARQGASRHASSTRTPRCAQETSRLSAVSPSQAHGAADAPCRIKGDAVSSSVRGSGPRPSPSGSRWTSNSLLPLQPPRYPRRRLSPVSHGPTRSWRLGDARAAHAPPGREPAHGCVLTALRAGTVRRGSVPTPE